MSFKKYLFSTKYCFQLLLLSAALTFTSCGSKSSNTNGDLPATLTATPTPADIAAIITNVPDAPDATPTPTLPPIVTGDAAAIAKQRVLDFLPSGRYDVALLSDTLKIDSDQYYTFLVSQKGTAIEPLIIVNQKSNELKCISSDSVVSDISTHPLYQKNKTENITWEGSYTTAADTSSGNYLTMTPVDDTHFQFTIYTYPSAGLAELSGSAEIYSNTASFTSESGITLVFSWAGTALTVVQTSGNKDFSFSGTYHYTEEVLPSSNITIDEALQHLLALTPTQAGLTNALSDYYFYVSEETEIVHDHLCYNILAYLPAQNRLIYAAQFYITIDGNKIYRLENFSSDDIEIYSFQPED